MSAIRLSSHCLTIILPLLCAATAAQSRPSESGMQMLDQPTAQLEIYGPRDIQSNWSGVGKNVLATDLCVVSSTGRFRLQVHSFAGGAMAAVHSSEKMAYTLRFRDASGQEQIQRVNGDAVVTLDGNSGADRDCSHGANSTLQIDLNETDMLARTSGRYVDQLRLSVDPL